MRTRALVIAMFLPACLVPTDDHSLGSPFPSSPGGGSGAGLTGGGAGGGGTGGGAGGGGPGIQRCVDLPLYDEVLCTTVWPVICGGSTCASGEVCCQTTGACVTPGSAACPNRPSTAENNPKSCGSNADCGSDEFCTPDQPSGVGEPWSCIAPSGHCQAFNNSGYCGTPPGSDLCVLCGCDGNTYPTMQAAGVAGVTAFHRGPCGGPKGHDAGAFTVSCGRSDQCPASAQCCFRTGKCFDTSEPWRCEPQPDGTTFTCATDAECNQPSGAGGGTGSANAYCAGDGCQKGPGVCIGRGSSSSCGGEVQPVCGCDGVTYVNTCWAKAAGTRVARTGACL